MIQYKVVGNTINYTDADNIDIHTWEEVFNETEPIVAREKAIKYYDDILEIIKEDGKKVEDMVKSGKGILEDIGLGIGVYLEITDPFEKIWDKVDIPNKPLYGLGTDLENEIKNLVENGEIEDEDDFVGFESDNQWIILGVGDGIFAEPLSFINGLENENKIYNYFNYDKKGYEKTIPFFDKVKKKMSNYKILEIPIEWNLYNLQQLYDGNIKNEEKKDEGIKKYLKMIKEGEGSKVEFKSTLCIDIKDNQMKEYIKHEIAKTIAAFLNTNGGVLFIGVNDKGKIIGLENDYKIFTSENKKDSFNKTFSNIIRDYLGKEYYQYIMPNMFKKYKNDFMVVVVGKAMLPVVLKYGKEQEFFIRATSGSEKLNIEETIKWIMAWQKK